MSEYKEKMAFILNQAQLELDSTVSACDQLTSKAFTLLSIAIPLLAALMGYFLVTEDSPSYLLQAGFMYGSIVFVSTCLLVWVVYVTPIYHSGDLPELLLQPEVMKASLADLYHREALHYQYYIKDNKKTHSRKSFLLRAAMALFIMAHLAGLVPLASSAVQLPLGRPIDAGWRNARHLRGSRETIKVVRPCH